MKGLRNILGNKNALIMTLVKHKSGRTVSSSNYKLCNCPPDHSVQAEPEAVLDQQILCQVLVLESDSYRFES